MPAGTSDRRRAGIAGLTCAHLLHPRHEITVFEAEDRPGGHENRHGGRRVFDATLALERRPARDLARLRLRYPAQPLRVLALIYGHAALLALSGAKYHPHPGRT